MVSKSLATYLVDSLTNAAVAKELITLLNSIGGGGSGATTALDNLTSTAVNADIIPGSPLANNLGAVGFNWFNVYTATVRADATLGVRGGGGVSITSDNATTTGNISITSGNATGASGSASLASGNTTATNQSTGDINISSGTAVNLTSSSKHSGAINIGSGASKGNSGAVNITSGSAGNGFSGANSGTIALTTGNAISAGTHSSGFVQLITGNGSNTSGAITMQTGTATSGAANQGDIQIYALQVTLANTQANTPVPLVFQDSSGIGGPFVAFQAPTTVASSTTWTLPDSDGTSGQTLTTDGAGTLSWAGAILAFTSSASANTTASQTLTVTGLLSTDIILSVTQKTAGSNNLPLLGWTTVANNAITVQWSANPGAGAVVVVAVKR